MTKTLEKTNAVQTSATTSGADNAFARILAALNHPVLSSIVPALEAEPIGVSATDATCRQATKLRPRPSSDALRNRVARFKGELPPLRKCPGHLLNDWRSGKYSGRSALENAVLLMCFLKEQGGSLKRGVTTEALRKVGLRTTGRRTAGAICLVDDIYKVWFEELVNISSGEPANVIYGSSGICGGFRIGLREPHARL